MAIDENARGRGYGSRILGTLEAEAKRRGAQKVVLKRPRQPNGILCQSTIMRWLVRPKRFWRHSPRADGEIVVIKYHRIMACIIIYANSVTVL
jgi:GNAT superfamily N-acetyltransferase